MHLEALLYLLGWTTIIAEGYLRMSCPGRLVRERLDPIVNPDGVSAHVHQIAGGAGFSAHMSYNDTRAAKCSSCSIKVGRTTELENDSD